VVAVETKLMSSSKKRPSKEEIIEEAWAKVGTESVGSRELGFIQRALEQNLGRGAVESPAKIARTLADWGVPLRHPEVLDADLAWRETQVETLFGPSDFSFDSIETAAASVAKLEILRAQFQESGNESGIESLRDYVRELKDELAERRTDTTREVILWLTIWLQNPAIFDNWLALRRKSPEFVRKFG
jgi:hypothetical protein